MQNVELRVEMTSCEPMALRYGELWPVLRHRLMILMICALTMPAAIELSLLFSPRALLDLAIYMLGPLVSVLVFGSTIWLITRLARGQSPVRLRVEPPALVAIVAADAVSLALGALRGDPPELLEPWRVLALLLWHTALSALVIIFAQRILIPAILRELRRSGDRPAAPAPAAAQPASHPAVPSTPAPLQTTPSGIFTWREIVTPTRALLSIQADGNYVSIATDEQTYFTKGPFREATAGLDPDAGLLVHRSLWLALGEIAGAYREKGELFLTRTDGTTVKVARPRQAEVTRALLGKVPFRPA